MMEALASPGAAAVCGDSNKWHSYHSCGRSLFHSGTNQSVGFFAMEVGDGKSESIAMEVGIMPTKAVIGTEDACGWDGWNAEANEPCCHDYGSGFFIVEGGMCADCTGVNHDIGGMVRK